MTWFQPLLAQTLLPTDVIPGAWHWMGLTFKELMMVLGSMTAVTLLLIIWAVYFRKKPSQHSHHYHYPAPNPATRATGSNGDEGEGSGERRYRRKRRRRRREHRPRNPTLAETGGLPPLRSEQPPDPLP